MKEVCQLIAAFAGSAGFALFYNLHGLKNLLTAAFGGLLGWLVFLFIKHVSENEFLAAYTATVSGSLYSEGCARLLKSPATGFLIITAIPMVPGAPLYRCMNSLLLGSIYRFREEGTYTLLFASCMAAGFVSATLLVRILLLPYIHRTRELLMQEQMRQKSSKRKTDMEKTENI